MKFINKINNRKKNLLIISFLITSLVVLSVFSAIPNTNGITSATTPAHKSQEQTSKLLSPLHRELGSTGNNINPNSLYSSEPAPMGLADYGIKSSGLFGTAYAYNTTSFLGGIAINSISVTNNTSNSELMTFQFNINFVFYDGSTEYVYWVQDVAFLNTSTNEIYFIDNVWNMSSPSQNMSSSTLTGNGSLSGNTYYYDLASSSLPGNFVNLNYPSDIQLMMNSTTTNQGVPEVAFMYNDGFGWQTYDNVYFSFVTDLSANFGFVVSGYQYEPNGYTPYDAELTLGGPGGGSSTTDVQSNINLTLQYWNGYNYQEISNAYNFGSHTAETIGNVVSGAYYTINNGSLYENIAAGNGTLMQVYSSSDISILNITMPLSSGTVYVNGTAHNFVRGEINLTLAPGTYPIKIYSGSLFYQEFTLNLTAGEYNQMEIFKSLVTFTASGIPKGTVWWVNFTGHEFSSSTNTISFYETNGTYSYTLSSNDKNYAPSITNGKFVVEGTAVSQNVVFGPVVYKVIFMETGFPAGNTWYVNITNGPNSGGITGTSYSFNLTNGTYSYTIATTDKTYEPSPASGSLQVNGASVSTSVKFSEVKYTVTFTESNLPQGTTWYVNVTGQTPSGSISAGSSFTIDLTNGTYSYTIATTDKTYSPSPYSSSFTVNGASVPVSIAFSKVQYTVKFTESGLSSGTTWYVNLSNGQSFKSTTSTISFNEPNGTYSYTIGNVSGYTVSPSSGSLTVSGSNASKAITFTVTSTPSTPPSTELYGIIGAVVAVAVIGSVLVIKRKRR